MAVTASRLSLFTSDIRCYLPLISLTAISYLLPLQQRLLRAGSFLLAVLRGRPSPHRSKAMFEHRQEKMDSLMRENEDFRRIYNHHQELDKRVTAAELGTAPMDDLALNQLKKEKLWAKDRLANLMDATPA